jgi:hypothetical protein
MLLGESRGTPWWAIYLTFGAHGPGLGRRGEVSADERTRAAPCMLSPPNRQMLTPKVRCIAYQGVPLLSPRRTQSRIDDFDHSGPK